jgi:acyl-CoA synthetase (AMP-forming)/AMP-acid ligase II
LIVARTPFDERQLRNHCAQRLQRFFVPVRFISVERIPRNDMAKIERGRLAELAKAI